MGLNVEFECFNLGLELPNAYAKVLHNEFDNVNKLAHITLGIYGRAPSDADKPPIRVIKTTVHGRPTVSTERVPVSIPIEGNDATRTEWQEKTIVTPVPDWELSIYRQSEAASAKVAYDFIKNYPLKGNDFYLSITADEEDNSHHAPIPAAEGPGIAGPGHPEGGPVDGPVPDAGAKS